MNTARRTLSFGDEAGIAARFPEQFRPDWIKRAKLVGGLTLAAAVFVFGLIRLEIPFDRLFSGTGRLIEFLGLMLPPDPGSWQLAQVYLQAMGETLAIALLGTLGGALLAFPISFLAARNVLRIRPLQLLTRRLLDMVRGVDTLIWALIWVGVVGLGPFAGILAVMCSDLGNFGKLFSEAFEAADDKPSEGVKATGGSHLHSVRFGMLPQVVPILASQVLYFFESNTRSATIIGIVGAGGIGLQLAEQIRVLEWQKVSFLILMILVTVAAIDWISSKLRFAIIGRKAVA
ncbi:phosphonate transport system permease protein [Rhodopseudomonas thermotolerans]|uniref:Phosphonate transport system permease protein n=2 Tax=Rhodopseudomonas TaxID=1073 RepID=A0A336JV47_9BRAD|nr:MULTISPECIES: phosphonate ABC transporter, permease protein PhnE [Rhodopseudomonas]RED38388.1 phosphonate transport system permease protein [Rhodopseudomonas pentothenatexigens]REG05973.1 phosphonate transport system permease protein [Rhodopseudomonas thermotolerans]SSW89841.1 phosphonate transport system permease protein [Rhodopseudomonas pentothenatexigens]